MTYTHVLGYYSECESSRLLASDRQHIARSRRFAGNNIRLHIWSLASFVLLLGVVIGMLLDSVSASAASASLEEVSSTYGQQDMILDTSFQESLLTSDASSLGSVMSQSGYQTYDVRPGDSLWAIARQHKPSHMHIRYYIEQLQELNGLTDSMLYEGMLLYLP